jgi:hypothetical protein
LGERLLCKQEVIGSIPFTSTIGTSTIWHPTAGVMCRWGVSGTDATFGEDCETPSRARFAPGAGC